MIKKKAKKVLSFIFADKETFSLENRLFLSAIVIGSFISLLATITSIFLPTPSIILIVCLSLLLFLSVLYYLVRFKRKFEQFIIPIITFSFLGISIIWIYNGGINGSNMMVGLVLLILALIIVKERIRIYVLALFITMIIVIYLIQYYRPDLITNFPNDKIRWIDNIITSIYSSVFIYLTIRFILKHYTNEAIRFEDSEKKYRYVFENVGEGIGLVDRDENFVLANPVAEKIFGVSKGELSGRNLKEFLSEQEYKRILEQTALRRKGERSTYEFELTRINGEKRNVVITAVPQYNEDKQFVGTHGIFIDITEYKQAELKLMEVNRKFMSLADNISGFIAYVNADTLKYEFVNDLYEKSFGIPKEKIIGSNLIDIIGDPNYQFALKYINEVKSGKSVSYENSFNLNSGKRWLQVNYTPIFDTSGKVASIAVLNFDITERKQAAETLKENEVKLLQLNVDKDRFISILSHDLRSPFNALIGLSEVLKEDLRKLPMDEIEEIVTSINNSIRNTYNLLEEILMWAKAQQGKTPFNPKYLNFRDICNSTLETLDANARAKNIRINFLAEDGVNVFAEEEMLKIVLRNLVSNAIKFSNNGGLITILCEQTPSEVTISVADNGIGIKFDDLLKLFDISQVITTRGTSDEPGSGLGLLLCKAFVEKHGGKIWVESEPGTGSNFKFTLPSPVIKISQTE
jgi:PAS domain S-box-containing protein